MKSRNKHKKLNDFTRLIGIVSISIILLINFGVCISAVPEGANITVLESANRVPDAATTLGALAGNVSQVNLYGKTVTQSWAGFYGNITGKITLENGAGSALMDWTATSPHGEVYASNQTITWTDGNIFCFNFTQSIANGHLNVTNYELSIGMLTDDSDGVDETFNESVHTTFYVGTNILQQNKCPSVNLYQNGTSGGNDFKEILLYDNTSRSVIYTSIISQNRQGFDNRSYDYQMIVAENGHNANQQTTTYYFYVELE